MSISTNLLFVVLITLGYLVAPVCLIFGWRDWMVKPSYGAIAVISLFGLGFASASAVLAITSIAYAHVHYFPFYDPGLLRIYRYGTLLSLAGFTLSAIGVWRRHGMRWHALLASIGTLAFWVMAAAGE